MQGVRSFFGHVSFYRYFIKDFCKTTKPLTLLLAEDTPFIFSDNCLEAFYRIKEDIILPPFFNRPIEVFPSKLYVMLLVIHGSGGFRQRRDKKPYVIYYASKTLDESQ